jgi:hypothetical protein
MGVSCSFMFGFKFISIFFYISSRPLRYSIKGKGRGKICPYASTEHHAMKAYWGSGSIVPRIIDFGSRWR